ncbi:MAG: hypothetical protein R6X15_09775 [Pseudomonadota bacterium]
MRCKPLLLALLLLSPPLAAEDREQPSLELLEYLGGWEDEEGNWLDPVTLGAADLKLAQRESETDDEQDDN